MEKKIVDVLAKAALLSPSSRGIKPWEFIIVDDTILLKKLSEAKKHGSQFLKTAPLGIVVCADSTKSDVWVEDTSIASILIQLAAEKMGLGSCWIQIRNRMHDDIITAGEYVKELLSLPEKYNVESIIAVGYPWEKKEEYQESDLLFNKVHKNKFNEKYFTD